MGNFVERVDLDTLSLALRKVRIEVISFFWEVVLVRVGGLDHAIAMAR